jgi:hypothetical protein
MEGSVVAGLLLTVGVLAGVSASDGTNGGVTAHSAFQRPPQQKQNVLPIVEVVGCLVASADNTWALTNGSDPVVSKVPFTTAATLKDAQARPLGQRRYRLLGAAPFTPEDKRSQKVVVKGVLIDVPDDARINVTSLQTTPVSCPRE